MKHRGSSNLCNVMHFFNEPDNGGPIVRLHYYMEIKDKISLDLKQGRI